ncbi:MAG: hypothetical protein M0R51_03960 [Clostridia bacterium]|jgi:hypothetical protein|nr:hypothetical protein [Clostridia bacterium]
MEEDLVLTGNGKSKKVRKDNLLFFGVLFIIIIPVMFIGVVWIKENKNPILFDYTADQWAVIISGLLGYLGTTFLGLFSLWQNSLYKKQNDEAQKRLETANNNIVEINHKQLALNEKYSKLQTIPYLSFLTMKILSINMNENKDKNIFELGIDSVDIELQSYNEKAVKKYLVIHTKYNNISNYPITQITIRVGPKPDNSGKSLGNLDFVEMNTDLKYYEAAVFIEPHEEKDMFIIIPSNQYIIDGFESEKSININLFVNNVFNKNTENTIIIQGKKGFYRQKVFTDLNPNT